MSAFPTDDDLRTVEQAEHMLAAAHLNLDRGLDVIDRLLHPDYVIVQPGGAVETKADTLASYRGGTRHWNRAAVDQLEVRSYGHTIVAIGRWRAAGRNGAERFDYQARFLSIWARHEGRWQNIAYQSTEIVT